MRGGLRPTSKSRRATGACCHSAATHRPSSNGRSTRASRAPFPGGALPGSLSVAFPVVQLGHFSVALSLHFNFLQMAKSEKEKV